MTLFGHPLSRRGSVFKTTSRHAATGIVEGLRDDQSLPANPWRPTVTIEVKPQGRLKHAPLPPSSRAAQITFEDECRPASVLGISHRHQVA